MFLWQRTGAGRVLASRRPGAGPRSRTTPAEVRSATSAPGASSASASFPRSASAVDGLLFLLWGSGYCVAASQWKAEDFLGLLQLACAQILWRRF